MSERQRALAIAAGAGHRGGRNRAQAAAETIRLTWSIVHRPIWRLGGWRTPRQTSPDWHAFAR